MSPLATLPPTADPLTAAPLPLFNWLEDRGTGALLHPTCFPNQQGIGVLDGAADAWLNFLHDAKISNWQICPLGPTGYGDSPYQCFSAFAGNPYLIDLEALKTHGLLTEADIAPLAKLPKDRVDFGWLYVTKWPALFEAFRNFKAAPHNPLPYGDFAAFRKDHASWLEPYALFLALKDHNENKPWWEWPEQLRFFHRAASVKLPEEVTERVEAHAFFQYVFFGQWLAVRAKARNLNINIIGDAPIFVARDSADVWSNPSLFQIDQSTGEPLHVAGVPPDYFSADGQLWGNPLYAWEQHSATSYAWWLERLRVNFLLCDIIRIDHFRGFDTYWSIPADAPNARQGEWKHGPGLELFRAVKRAMPECKLIAEDLGELMPSVHTLRAQTGLPGMTILQFAFGGKSDNIYLPHNHEHNSVVYPGTHDNDTTLGWYATAGETTQDHVRRYLRISGQEIGWDFIRACYRSVSKLAVFSAQDLLSLGTEARFNSPGIAAGNWQWRYHPEQIAHLHRDTAEYLRSLADLYGR